jgi:hypothetical protein
MSSEIIEKVDKIAQKYGIPKSVWYPIMMLESGGNPNARAFVNSQKAKELGQGAEDSRGLFQINTFVWKDANSTLLYDPEYNAEYSFKNIIGPSTKKGIEMGYSGWELTKYVEKHGQRPKWTDKVESALYKRYTDLVGGNPDLTLVTSLEAAPFQGEFEIPFLKDIKAGSFLILIYVGIFLVLLFSLNKVFEIPKGKG